MKTQMTPCPQCGHPVPDCIYAVYWHGPDGKTPVFDRYGKHYNHEHPGKPCKKI